MSKHTIKINKDYFADLGARYVNEFDKVSDALSYASNTESLDHTKDSFSKLKKAINNKQDKLEYDVTCILSVFSTADDDMKKRASELIGVNIINSVAGGGEIVVDYYDIKPDLDSPRELDHTQYGYVKNSEGDYVYDHPEETGKYLYQKQGSAYPDQIEGTCGLCSCLNVLRMAGVKYDEKEIVDYAVEHGWCDSDYDDPGMNGGTSAYDREQLLEAYGVPCSCITPGIDSLASSVEQGKGVIISVRADYLCPDVYGKGNHAITVTSVKRDSNGNIKGFYVCDSNDDNDPDIPNYYSAETIQNAFSGNPMVVTDSPIR